MPACLICSKEFKTINNTHLMHHGMSVSEYRVKFPLAERHSEEYLKNLKGCHKGQKYPTWEEQFGKEAADKRKAVWRKDMLERVRSGVIPREMSKPHRVLFKAISDNLPEGVLLENEYKIKTYLVDIACPDKKKVIEVDGDYFHNKEGLDYASLDPIQKKTAKNDKQKSACLKNRGWEILRVWESDINENLETAVKRVLSFLSLPNSAVDISREMYLGRTVECVVCGKPLTGRQIISGYKRCSLKCRGMEKRTTVISKCKECGNDIIFSSARSFCNPVCQKKYEKKHSKERAAKAAYSIRNSAYHSKIRNESRIDVECPVCGKRFWLHRCRIASGIRACSAVCGGILHSRKFKENRNET